MSQATPINIENLDINFTLKPRAVSVLLQALDQLPHGIARPLHDYLNEQVNIQAGAFAARQAVEAAEKAEKVEAAGKVAAADNNGNSAADSTSDPERV